MTKQKAKKLLHLDKILDIYECKKNEWDIVGRVGGDVVNFRVRKTSDGYSISER